MMDDHEFCDECPGCRPALAFFDAATKRMVEMSDDSPTMVEVNRMWDNDTTYAQRKAFIEVTLHNSRIPVEVKMHDQVLEKIETILRGHSSHRP